MRIETLTTCHNRRDKTLLALRDLNKQALPKGCEIGHTIVDDGSSDGTGMAVKNAYPNVNIILGNGHLFWAGGMRYGWYESLSRKNFDYLFVYNDDVRFDQDALLKMIGTARDFVDRGGSLAHVITGAFRSELTQETTYSGVVRDSRWHPLRFRKLEPPTQGYITVDSTNMNGCLISKSALQKVGFLSDYFIHCGADFEYGLKLRKAGGAVVLVRDYIGTCENDRRIDYDKSHYDSLITKYRNLLGPKGQPISQRFRYHRQHGGWLWPFLFLLPYLSLPLKHVVTLFVRQRNA